MNAVGHWLSRITPNAGIGYRQLMALGDLDPYNQHRILWKLFDLPPREERVGQSVPFLFRAEEQDGLPVFYVLSARRPEDREALWHVEAKCFAPDIRVGDQLAFKLRVNPVVARGTPGGRGRRHDVVMDAKQRLGWKNQRESDRPSLADLAYESGACWLRERQDGLGVAVHEAGLRVDGYRTWRQRGGRGIVVSTLDMEGSLHVVDPLRFKLGLMRGVGPAKAFGCGLLLVRRIRGTA